MSEPVSSLRFSQHAVERMAQRNLPLEMILLIVDHGTHVHDGYLMRKCDIRRCMMPYLQELRVVRKQLRDNRNRGRIKDAERAAGERKRTQEEAAVLLQRAESIKRARNVLVCVEDNVVVTVQRLYPAKQKRALRGPARQKFLSASQGDYSRRRHPSSLRKRRNP